MSMITSAKNAAVVRSKYKKLKQAEYASKLSAEQEQIDMDLNKDEAWDAAETDAKEKLNDAIGKQLDAVTDAAKKKIIGPELRKKRDEQLGKLKANFEERYKTQKGIARKKADKETAEITAAIKEVSDLPIDNEFLKKKTAEFTSTVDFDEELSYLDQSTEQALAASEDPDQQAAIERRAAKKVKDLKAEKTTELTKAKEATDAALAAQETKLASATADKQESVEKLKNVFKAQQEYQEAAEKIIANPEDEAAAEAIIKAKKDLSDAEDKIGKKVMIDNGLGDEDTWEEEKAKLTASIDELRSQYKTELAGIVKKAAPKAKAAAPAAPAVPVTQQTASYTPNVSGSHHISESIATKFKRAMDQKGPRL
jgi:hypothetical protein